MLKATRALRVFGSAAAGVLLLGGSVAEASLLQGQMQEDASQSYAAEEVQHGLMLPGEKQLDFNAVGPAPLAEVQMDPGAHSLVQAAAKAGVAHLAVEVERGTGRLTLRTEPEAGSGGSSAGERTLIAWAAYNNTVQENGWAHLEVSAASEVGASMDLKMYAAGFLEGFATARQMRDFRHNAGVLMEEDEQKHHALENIQGLFGRSLAEISKQSGVRAQAVLLDGNLPKDAWWRQARLALMQLWGILDGYNGRAAEVGGKPMSLVDLVILNSDGETPELEQAYDMEEYLLRQSHEDGGDDKVGSFLQRRSHQQRRSAGAGHLRHGPRLAAARAAAARRARRLQQLDDASWRKIKESTGRCSALVRLTKDNQDILVGHTTFSDYSEMTRIFKHYDLPLGDDVARKISFSSYPGVAGSTDDYYLLSSGLVITETTISMLTDEPYDKIDDNATRVPDFMRIMLANRLARNGTHWAQLMAGSATGTYSSQWMVVDYNRFAPGKPVGSGTLTVLEQVPGLTHTQDMSEKLQKQGFWASENRAWFQDVRDSIGETDAEELHGKLFSAEKNPRANIFAATALEVQNIADMRHEMRRNRWPLEIDGGEANTPDHAIAARGDLAKEHPSANGAVDAKVTNRCLAKKLRCDAISGPTADTQKPFRWRDASTGKDLFDGMPHEGLPDLWNFDWVRMAPDSEAPLASLTVKGEEDEKCD